MRNSGISEGDDEAEKGEPFQGLGHSAQKEQGSAVLGQGHTAFTPLRLPAARGDGELCPTRLSWAALPYLSLAPLIATAKEFYWSRKKAAFLPNPLCNSPGNTPTSPNRDLLLG